MKKYYIRYLTPVYMYLFQNIKYSIYNRTKVNIVSKFLDIDEQIIKDYYKETSHIKVNVPGMAAALDSIYVVIRALKPNIIVETGVANGASSFYLLLALKRNKKVIFSQLTFLIWILQQCYLKIKRLVG